MTEPYQYSVENEIVELTPDSLIIHEYVTKDATIMSLAQAHSEAGKNLEILVEQIFELGARVLSFGVDSAGVALIDHAAKSASEGIIQSAESLQKATNQSLDELVAPNGKLNTSINTALTELRNNLNTVITGEDAPLKKVLDVQITKVQEAVSAIYKNAVDEQKNSLADLLNPDHSMSPLQSLQNRIKDLDEKLSEFIKGSETDIKLNELEDEILSKTTLKGRPYEQQAAEALTTVAKLQGDTCEATGDNANGAVRNSKSGDAVSEFIGTAGQSVRIVMEAKNEKLNTKQWLEEAKKARKNRQAVGFIGMAKTVDQVPGGQMLWVKDQKTVVIAFDPETDSQQILEAVYKMLKISVLTHLGDLDEQSLSLVSVKLSEANSLLEKFQDSKRHISSIRTATKSLEDSLLNLSDELQETLSAANKALSNSFTSEESSEEVESEEENVSPENE